MRLRERRARPLMKQLPGQFCHQLHAAWRIRLRPSARRGPMGDRRPPGYSQLPGWSDYITGCKRIQPHHLVHPAIQTVGGALRGKEGGGGVVETENGRNARAAVRWVRM